MCSLICNILFKHSINGINMANSIAETISKDYLNKLYRNNLSLSISRWMPRINDECKKIISIHISQSTKELKLPILNMSMDSNDYICNQIAFYISNCILKNQLLDFTINELIEIDSFFTQKKINIHEEIYNSFKETFSKMNDGSTININTDDAIEIEVLRVKFNILVKSLLEKINFLFIINATYQDYTQKKNKKNDMIRNSCSKFI